MDMEILSFDCKVNIYFDCGVLDRVLNLEPLNSLNKVYLLFTILIIGFVIVVKVLFSFD